MQSFSSSGFLRKYPSTNSLAVLDWSLRDDFYYRLSLITKSVIDFISGLFYRLVNGCESLVNALSMILA